MVPREAAHGPEEHRMGPLTHWDNIRGQGNTTAIDGRAAHDTRLKLEFLTVLLTDSLKDFLAFGHHLCTYAIARKNRNIPLHKIRPHLYTLKPHCLPNPHRYPSPSTIQPPPDCWE